MAVPAISSPPIDCPRPFPLNVSALPQYTAVQVQDFLLAYPLPAIGTYVLYRLTDDPFAVVGCSSLIPDLKGMPFVNTDFIGMDPGNGRLARVQWTGCLPVYVEPHWNDLAEVKSFYGSQFLPPPACQNQMDRRGELVHFGWHGDCKQFQQAMRSLMTADPGVFFVPYDFKMRTAQFSLYFIGDDRVINWIPISISATGQWFVWENRALLMKLNNFSELTAFFHLKSTLLQWETLVVQSRDELFRASRFSGVKLATPLPIKGPVPSEMLDSLSGFCRTPGPTKRDRVVNVFPQSYDRDFFQRAVADGALIYPRTDS